MVSIKSSRGPFIRQLSLTDRLQVSSRSSATLSLSALKGARVGAWVFVKNGFPALSQQKEPLLRDGFLLRESPENLVRTGFRSNRSLRLLVTESFGVGVGDRMALLTFLQEQQLSEKRALLLEMS